MNEWPEPSHMDRASRNRRLYDRLLSEGLYVRPVPKHVEGVGNLIDHLIVSVGLPEIPMTPAGGDSG